MIVSIPLPERKNHDRNFILGLIGENIWIREEVDGLYCRLKPFVDEFSVILLESVGRGEVGASPGFNVYKEEWDVPEYRRIVEGQLVEVSLCDLPAYGLGPASACLRAPE